MWTDVRLEAGRNTLLPVSPFYLWQLEGNEYATKPPWKLPLPCAGSLSGEVKDGKDKGSSTLPGGSWGGLARHWEDLREGWRTWVCFTSTQGWDLTGFLIFSYGGWFPMSYGRAVFLQAIVLMLLRSERSSLPGRSEQFLPQLPSLPSGAATQGSLLPESLCSEGGALARASCSCTVWKNKGRALRLDCMIPVQCAVATDSCPSLGMLVVLCWEQRPLTRGSALLLKVWPAKSFPFVGLPLNCVCLHEHSSGESRIK